MNPTVAIFETNLRPHAFELVTTQGVLHLHGASLEDAERWVRHLRGVVASAPSLTSDPLLRAAAALADAASTYTLRFETKRPLNIVLEVGEKRGARSGKREERRQKRRRCSSHRVSKLEPA